jgi:hypothetical protein
MKALIVLTALALAFGAGAGYVMNILALVNNAGESVGLIVGRAIGIFLPFVGAILGWL